MGGYLAPDSLFDRTLMVTLLPNGVGYTPTDKAVRRRGPRTRTGFCPV